MTQSPSPHSADSDILVLPSGPLGGYVEAPPSKNHTTRLILAAALAEGESLVRRPATNDDARALVACLRLLGADLREEGLDLRVRGVAGRPRNPGTLNPGNAGAVLRLLLGVACLVEGETRFVTDHADSLGKRPNEDLLSALRELGAETAGTGPAGRLPIVVSGGAAKVRGGAASVSGARSSQFLSSLLFLAPHLELGARIAVTGAAPGDPPALVSRPLIDQTMEAIDRFGGRIQASPDGFAYEVPGGQRLLARDVLVNGDWPSAAALMSAVAVAGGMATLIGLREDAQGERRAREVLEIMGCAFEQIDPERLLIHSRGELRAVTFNGDLATDAVLALEAAACLAEGTSRFEGIGNLRIKECDRIREPLEQLARVGVLSTSGEDWVEITGRPEGYEGGVEVDCRGDHRVAQMLAIVGARCEKGLILRGADCVSKSYPAFFRDLARLGVKLAPAPPRASR